MPNGRANLLLLPPIDRPSAAAAASGGRPGHAPAQPVDARVVQLVVVSVEGFLRDGEELGSGGVA